MGIKIKNLYKKFDSNDRYILNNIDLEITDGEFICLLGPSGCGKSTLLNLIAGLEKPNSGTIEMDGRLVTEPGPDRTVMFQESALFPWLTVAENVRFGMKINKYSKEEQTERIKKYLAMVKLTEYAGYHVHEISGGMKQRAAMARALCLDSRVLLMDEPFAALDKQTINTLRTQLEQIWEETGKTMIFVTHSVEEAMFFADKVVMLSNLGHIKRIIPITFPRPRQIDDAEFVHLRSEILHELRSEVRDVE